MLRNRNVNEELPSTHQNCNPLGVDSILWAPFSGSEEAACLVQRLHYRLNHTLKSEKFIVFR